MFSSERCLHGFSQKSGNFGRSESRWEVELDLKQSGVAPHSSSTGEEICETLISQEVEVGEPSLWKLNNLWGKSRVDC